jgi:CheY-like chemotaxis protein
MTTVLIADDEPNLRLLVSATLLSDECDVLEAEDGDEAWDLIVEHQPRIVILDLQMPGRTGLELAEAIRRTPAISDTRIIMLTSKAQRADIERGYRAGADVYLTKPFLPIELLNAVERAMEAA